MNKKTIPYVSGTINPVSGCTRFSRGCDHCYAHVWATRFRGGDFSLRYFPDKLEIIRRKKTGLWFVGSMTDLFQDGIDKDFVDRILAGICLSPAKFLMLTKRAANMAEYFSSRCPDGIPPNLGIGVTAEGQAEWDERVPILLGIKAAMRWVSAEPMLEAVHPGEGQLDGISWLVCGPETGAGKRPCDPKWIEDLAWSTRSKGTQFFDKRTPDNDLSNYTCREYPEGWKP